VAQTPIVRESAFKARFAGEDITPDKEEADTVTAKTKLKLRDTTRYDKEY
jgi:hypothetical protein